MTGQKVRAMEELKADLYPLLQRVSTVKLGESLEPIADEIIQLFDLDSECSSQISVEYTCCGSQEFWPLNANGDLELTHAEVCQPCPTDEVTE